MLIPSVVNGARVCIWQLFRKRKALWCFAHAKTAPVKRGASVRSALRRHQSYIKRHHNGNNNKIAHKHTRWRALTFDPVGWVCSGAIIYLSPPTHTEWTKKRRRAWPRASPPGANLLHLLAVASGVAADLIDYSVSINRH